MSRFAIFPSLAVVIGLACTVSALAFFGPAGIADPIKAMFGKLLGFLGATWPVFLITSVIALILYAFGAVGGLPAVMIAVVSGPVLICSFALVFYAVGAARGWH